MSTIRRVAKNTSVVLVWNTVSRFIGLLIAIYLARYLGVVGYGNYSFIIAYALFFGVFIDLGINSVIVREICKNRERTRELIANGVGIKLALFVLVFLIAFSVISFASYSSEVKTGVLIALLGLVFTSMFSLLSTIFQADLKMEYPAFADLASKLVLGGAILLISYQKGGLFSIVLATLLAGILSFILLYVLLLGRIRAVAEFNTRIWREMLGPAVLLGLSGIFASVMIRVDTILISLIRGNIEVGYYAPPSQLTDAVTFIPLAFMTSLLPLMSTYSKTSKQALDKSFRLAAKYMFALSIPMAFGTTLLSGRIITAVYGAEFLPSAPVLVVMVWCDILYFYIIILEGLLTSIDKQKNIFIATVIAALSNVVLNLLLIPPLGFIGASIALLLSYLILTITHIHLMPRLLRAIDTNFIIRSTIASLVMALFIEYSTLHLYALILLSALLYFILLAVLGGVSNEDIEILKKLRMKA